MAYDPLKAFGTHNKVILNDACVNGDFQNIPNSGSITLGYILSPAQIKDVIDFDVRIIDKATSKTLTYGGHTQGFLVRQKNLINGNIKVDGFSASLTTVGEYPIYYASFTLESGLYSYSQFAITLPQYITVDIKGISPKCQILKPT